MLGTYEIRSRESQRHVLLALIEAERAQARKVSTGLQLAVHQMIDSGTRCDGLLKQMFSMLLAGNV